MHEIIECKSCGIEFSNSNYICPQCGMDNTPKITIVENQDSLNLRKISDNLKSTQVRFTFESTEARDAAKYIRKELDALEDYAWQVRSNIDNPDKQKPLSTTKSDKAKLELLATEVGAMVWLIPKTDSQEVTRTVDDVQGLIRKIKKFVVKRISEL